MSKIINGVASEYEIPTSRCKTLEDLVNNYETRLKYHNYEFDELSYKLLIIDIKKILQENKQLKEELQKADSITQSCIFEGKEESTINFRECLNKLKLYKEVIEEVREHIEDSCYYPELENYSNMTSEEVKELVQILDKVRENK